MTSTPNNEERENQGKKEHTPYDPHFPDTSHKSRPKLHDPNTWGFEPSAEKEG